MWWLIVGLDVQERGEMRFQTDLSLFDRFFFFYNSTDNERERERELNTDNERENVYIDEKWIHIYHL